MADSLPFPGLFDHLDPEEHASQPPPPNDPQPHNSGGPLPAATPSLPADFPVRQQPLDPRRSFIVEAPAGSGKTGLLVQRLLKLLADPLVDQPEQILAITFTRKATAELRDRVLSQLEAAAEDKPLPATASEFDRLTRTLAIRALERDRDRTWGLLADPRRLRIRTIDSLCAEIAGSLPLLAPAGTARTPVEDARPLYRQAARRTLMQLGQRDTPATQLLDDALSLVLLHRDVNLADVETLLAGMLATREQWGELVPLDRASLTDDVLDLQVRPRLESTLESLVCAGLSRVVEVLPASVLEDLTALARELHLQPAYAAHPSPLAICGSLSGPPEARAEHLDHWRALIHLVLTRDGWRSPRGLNSKNLGFELPLTHKRRLADLLEGIQSERTLRILQAVRELPPPRYPDDQWQVAKALFRLLLHALAELKLLYGERRECDFSELSLAAREALSAASGLEDLATSSGGSLRHLLVDEMQDTASAQYELLEMLTQSWDGASQTLFLVGDPKQSIYLFRQARVERFLRTMREGCLGDLPLTPLRLTANFRSQPHLVESLNSAFATLFPSTDNQDHHHSADDADSVHAQANDVPFVASVPARPATLPDPSAPGSLRRGIAWHASVLDPNNAPPPGTPSQPVLDAREIRRIVAEWRDRPLPPHRHGKPWTIAVLARARHHLAPIAQEFSHPSDPLAGPIPFRAVDVTCLSERPEILDLLALTRALLHPADRTAWFATLRAPWCGLSLADLLTLADEAAPANTATVLDLLQTRTALLSPEAHPLLARCVPTLRSAAAQAGRIPLPQLVERTWLSLGGDAALPAPARNNTIQFFHLLRETDPADLPSLQQKLSELYADPGPAGPGAVDLMTIHASKGLEWDLVLVPQIGAASRSSEARLLNWLELDAPSGAATVLLAPIHARGDRPDDLYRFLNRIHTARERAERKRLFYVAATRAREELHLFASAKRSHGGQLVLEETSLLKAIWPAAARHFEDAHANATQPSHRNNLVAFPGQNTAALTSEPHPDLLDLAASADPDDPAAPTHGADADTHRYTPRVERLPLHFDPLARFQNPHPLTSAAALKPQAQPFSRPEGSFAVRAFGNVVHRFLQVLAQRLGAGVAPPALHAELPSWQPRLHASFRAEGLAPAAAERESHRALTALTRTLADPIGLWLLQPHPEAATEQPVIGAAGTLRVDRTFVAGEAPLSTAPVAANTIWIIDFKTTEQGSRANSSFEAEERAKYTAQLEAYAAIRRNLPGGDRPIRLGLYYPLIPRLLQWQSQP